MYRSFAIPRAREDPGIQGWVAVEVLCKASLHLRNLLRAISSGETDGGIRAGSGYLSRQATAARQRVLNALLRLEHHAPTLEAQGEYEFARRMFNALVDGWREPYVVACYYTYGLHPAKLLPALQARRALAQWELYRHAPQVESTVRHGAAEESRRHLYEMCAPPLSPIQKPLPTLPHQAAQVDESNPLKAQVKLTLLPPTGTKD